MRFSRRILMMTTASILLSSCAYIIPPEQNPPRHNTVNGDIRKPQLNVLAPQSALAPRQASPLSNPEARPMQQVAAAPVPPPAAPAVSERRVPAENQAFQVSAMGYAPITTVPPRPSVAGPDSTKERMTETQSTLERDRAIAAESRDALARDAAAEPSMLSDLPKTDKVVPPADPVKVTPIVQPPALAPLPRSAPAVVTPGNVRSEPLAPMPSVVSIPATPVAMAAAQPHPIMQKPLSTPIPTEPMAVNPLLAPPAPMGSMPTVSRPTTSVAMTANREAIPTVKPVVLTPPTPSLSLPRVKPGDFNPLTAGEPAPELAPIILKPLARNDAAAAPIASTDARYATIAPSRYYERR